VATGSVLGAPAIVRGQGAPLKVGVLLPRSGAQAGIGQDCWRGVEIAPAIFKDLKLPELAIMNGDTETGITIMRVVKALDAGAMFAKAKRPIGPDETSADVERDLAQLGAPLLIRVIEQIASASAHEEPQDDHLSTYAPRLTKDEGVIDWTLPAGALHNRVRGLHPWPHAYTYLEGARLIVLKSRVDDRPTIEEPGTLVAVSRDEIEVSTGGGGRLALLNVQPEGRRPMQVRDFLAGHPLSPGLRLTAG
jgi:methionyl-tRNA formyltransferase